MIHGVCIQRFGLLALIRRYYFSGIKFNYSTGIMSDEPEVKKAKIECSFGEKCYRKKEEHFQEFTHSHINKLLEEMGDSSVIPVHYKPFVSFKTLVEQVEIVRELNGKSASSSYPLKASAEFSASQNSETRDTKLSHRSNSPRHSSLQNSPQKQSSSIQAETSRSKGNCQSNIPRTSSSVMENSRKEQSSTAERVGNSRNSQTLEPSANPAWDAAMANYKRDAKTRMKISLKEKMDAASPYNIFLTTIKDSKPTHSEPLSISFPELLDPYFGELERSLQINFMIEFGFLLAQYSITGYKSRPLTLLYGECDCELGDKFKHFLTHEKVKPPSSFGSHHTKMMIFRYTNKSVRIIVSTANLVESDWENRTQGLWISPECRELGEGCDSADGESMTHFKRDLLEYLAAYRLTSLQPWLEILRRADMSSIKVFFIGSVPGSHKMDNWGQLKLGKLLKAHVSPNEGQVIAQCSSIGSLGPQPNSWLQGELLSTFGQAKTAGRLIPLAPLKLVYPTFKTISNSYDGLLGGGCLPYRQATHRKQEWLTAFMCDWKSDGRHRTKAPPHIKSYCRVSKDLKQLYYFLLTSANASKAAWGQKAKNGSLNILSYEAGVLLIPQILVSKDYFPLSEEVDGLQSFSLPYDLPLVPYNHSDVPWFMDNIM